MKIGEIFKSVDSTKRDTSHDLQLINQFTRKELTEEDVYIFPVALCNNDVDRDIEKFTVDSLNVLSKLFSGKTGILDHQHTTKNQVCRIFDTQVMKDDSRTTKDGEAYHVLMAWAYILKTEANAGLISEIDGGIKKEVSVGCAISKMTCSICGKELSRWGGTNCEHKRGNTYDGQLAFVKLDGPTDAYEFSFVAVPAQPGAGVQKQHTKGGENEMFLNEETQKQLEACFGTLTGVDVKSVVLTQNADGTYAVKAEEIVPPPTVFLTAEQVKSKAGKDVTAEEVLQLFDTVKDLEAAGAADKAKAAELDIIRNEVLEDMMKSGVQAMGNDFIREVWDKSTAAFSIAELKALGANWNAMAKNVLNAGKHLSVPDAPANAPREETPDDYKV